MKGFTFTINIDKDDDRTAVEMEEFFTQSGIDLVGRDLKIGDKKVGTWDLYKGDEEPF